MRTKISITLDSGEEIAKEYDVTLEKWPWQKVMIQSLIWSYIKQEQATIKLKRKCETCGKSCEGCTRREQPE